jgi:hypothetical protein
MVEVDIHPDESEWVNPINSSDDTRKLRFVSFQQLIMFKCANQTIRNRADVVEHFRSNREQIPAVRQFVNNCNPRLSGMFDDLVIKAIMQVDH